MSAIQKENFSHLNVVSFCRLGVLACYLDPLDLGSYLQDSAVSSALWQQLAHCMNKGFISDSGRVSQLLLKPLPFLFHVVPQKDWLSVLNCVLLTAVFLVDTSRSGPERQQHGSPTAGWPQWSVASFRSFLPVSTPIKATPGTPLTTWITQIFTSTGQQPPF